MQLTPLTPPLKVIVILKEISFNCKNAGINPPIKLIAYRNFMC